MMQLKPITAALLMLLSSTVLADEALKQEMQVKFPGTPITDANKVEGMDGLVELIVGGKQIFYTNTQGNRLLIGHIFDPKTNLDLTQQKLDELNTIDWSLLPLKDAITIKKGKGEREMAVFTDPDCPYCKKLEEELKLLDNITVHIFAYPLAMHPQAKETAQKIVCAKDKSKAWLDYMSASTMPSNDGKCQQAQAIDRNLALGEKLGVNGTPALIAKNGKIKPGFLPAAQLEAWINANQPLTTNAKVKK